MNKGNEGTKAKVLIFYLKKQKFFTKKFPGERIYKTVAFVKTKEFNCMNIN